MTNVNDNARIAALKAQARRLRSRLADHGTAISHSQSLELVARQNGARDWNTLRALAARPDRNRPLAIGDRVAGTYLGQPFTGHVHGLSQAENPSCQRITVRFDEPVDVVRFDSFSAFRRQVSATIGANGQSVHKTSDGVAQMIVRAV
ncbi:MAG: glyoxalase superfamily protein [Jhaorihella sp.]